MESKKCSKCGVFKLLEEFHSDSHRKDGKTSACKICRTKHTVEYHKQNETWKKDSHIQYNKRRMSNPEAKTMASHASTKWQRNNPEKSVPYNRANASMKRVRTKYPEAICCDIEDILPFYQNAFQLEQEMGIKFQVDHKVPLVAGGKHEPQNLEVISEDKHKEKSRQEFAIMRQLMEKYYLEYLKGVMDETHNGEAVEVKPNKR